MTTPAAGGGSAYTADAYFELVARGVLAAEDRVELLEGLVVSAPPQAPLHSTVTMAAFLAIQRAVADRATIRLQMPFLAGPRSVPEPDVAVVEGTLLDYAGRHPSHALLVVEVADSSLPQDRLTKSRIYAAAAVPEYWIVNIRDRCVEVFTGPDADRRVYAQVRSVPAGDNIAMEAFPEALIAVRELFPGY